MDKQHKIYAVVGVVAAAALIYLMNRRDGIVSDAINAPLNDPFTAPYYADGKVPSDGFVSNINVNVDANAFAGLSNQYMPVFGFVGVGVTGQLPRNIINVSTITNTAPPAPVVAASNQPAAVPVPTPSGWTMINSPRRGNGTGSWG